MPRGCFRVLERFMAKKRSSRSAASGTAPPELRTRLLIPSFGKHD
jgi:hypothetical protein